MATQDSLRTKLRNLPVLAGPFQQPDLASLPESPQDAFKTWLDDAIAADVKEPHAMTVSTVDEDGCPDARVLILKNVDHRGFSFAVKGESPKGRQIANRPSAALTFYWPSLGRQIRVRGMVAPLPEEECRADFEARPLESRVSAVASKQSQVLESREVLVRGLDEAREAMANSQSFPDWRVYAVDPTAVEFWLGAGDRLHRRLRYVRGDGGWRKQLLWP